MERIKIIYLITDLSTGGAQTTLLRLLTWIDREQYAPQVCCFYNSKGRIAGHLMEQKIPVIDLGMAHKWRIDALFRLMKWLQREQPVILHTWLFHANLAGRLIGSHAKVPIIITSRRNIAIGGSWREKLIRWTSRLDDKVIAVCETVRKIEIEQSDLPPEKVVTIYNGIDVLPFTLVPNEASRKIRSFYGIRPDEFLLGSIGRLCAQKGFTDLISSFLLIRSHVDNVRLIIIGEGELRRQLESQVKRNNLSESVIFTGLRDDIPELLSTFDIYISSSHWEGLPNVVIEAMAASKPVVATSVGGTPEVVINGGTGLLVPARNPEALAHAVIRLLMEPDMASSMGKAGAERVAQCFSVQRMVNKVQSLYQDLIIEKGLF